MSGSAGILRLRTTAWWRWSDSNQQPDCYGRRFESDRLHHAVVPEGPCLLLKRPEMTRAFVSNGAFRARCLWPQKPVPGAASRMAQTVVSTRRAANNSRHPKWRPADQGNGHGGGADRTRSVTWHDPQIDSMLSAVLELR